MPAIFTEDATLPYAPGVLYELNGRVDVGEDDGAHHELGQEAPEAHAGPPDGLGEERGLLLGLHHHGALLGLDL
ncbi:MAG: hypothetical protein P8X51_18725, partial [Maritimibacter sp.]